MTSFFDQVPLVPQSQVVLPSTDIFNAGGNLTGSTSSVSNVIEYFDGFGSTNGVDRGDLGQGKNTLGGAFVSSSNLGFTLGGRIPGSIEVDEIEQINRLLQSGNSADRGDLTLARRGACGSFGVQFVFAAGSALNDVIDSFDGTLQTIVNALDKGDLVVGRLLMSPTGAQGATKSNFLCGISSAVVLLDTIEQLDNTTQASSNGIDRGDMGQAKSFCAGASGNGIGFGLGGGTGISVEIETFDPEQITTITASDKGDLLQSNTEQSSAQANDSFCYNCGGTVGGPSNAVNTIQRINSTTTSENAIDHADLTEAKDELAAI